MYGQLGWEYHSKNDIKWDDRQQYLKFVICKQIRDTDIDKLLNRTMIEDDDDEFIVFAEKAWKDIFYYFSE